MSVTVHLELSAVCVEADCSTETPEPSYDCPFTQTLLVGYSDTSNIKSLEFPFHTQRASGAESPERPRAESATHRGGRKKLQRTVGLAGTDTNGDPGRGTHEEGWRGRRTNQQRAPKGKARSAWKRLPSSGV